MDIALLDHQNGECLGQKSERHANCNTKDSMNSKKRDNVRMKHAREDDFLRETESRSARPLGREGFTLIELMIVTVIIGLLATIAIPQFDDVRQRAYNTAALADLNHANKEIERFYNDNYRYPADEDELIAAGYAHSTGVEFTIFQIRDASDPETTRVHMHIEHEASQQYYHYEYPKGYAGVPELRWK